MVHTERTMADDDFLISMAIRQESAEIKFTCK